MAENEPLAQIAPGAVELQLRLGEIRPISSGGGVGQRLKREQDRGPGVSLNRALLVRQIGEEPRFRDLRLAQIGLCLVGASRCLFSTILGFALFLIG